MQYEIDVNGRLRQVHVRRANGAFAIEVDGREWIVDAARVDAHTLSLLVREASSAEGQGRIASHEVTLAADVSTGALTVGVGDTPTAASIDGRRRWARGGAMAQLGSGPQRMAAPMPGKIVRVLVKTGEAVSARQPVVVIEAMKMENELRAASDGTVAEIHVRDGQSVDAGALLVVIHR